MYKDCNELLADLYTRTAPKSDRSRIQNFLNILENPQLKLKSIQVAGTNGKGSVTNYVSQILIAEGYKVGIFTSPHLLVHNDRIRINNYNIPDAALLRLANQYMNLFDQCGLNMFEIDFVIAILYFLEEKVDYAVFEAGMGGRLDATSELHPLVNAITNIGMDHMQFLGDSLAKIAWEKAGILKENTVCVSGEQKAECVDVFNEVAKQVQAKMRYVEPLEVKQYPDLYLSYRGECLHLGEVALYQRYNAAVALGIIEELVRQNITVSMKSIHEGMTHAWAGRFERLMLNPEVYVDGAHNEEGVEALCETIRAYHKPTYILFSALKDKPAEKMIADLQSVSDEVIVTTFENKRARKREDYPSGCVFFVDYQEAIEYLLQKEGMHVITGSLYFVSLVKEYFSAASAK